MVLPPATNFRLIGTIFNNSSSIIASFRGLGNIVQRSDSYSAIAPGVSGVVEDIGIACPLAVGVNVLISASVRNSEIGHPNFGSRTGNSRNGGSYPGSVDFNLEFCRYWTNANSLYPNYYWYNPMFGF